MKHIPELPRVATSLVLAIGDITERGGKLWLERRGGKSVNPPVEIRFTDDELERYYQQVVQGSGPEDGSRWEWWKTLVSTHLAEAIHELDRLDGQQVIGIGDYGSPRFASTR